MAVACASRSSSPSRAPPRPGLPPTRAARFAGRTARIRLAPGPWTPPPSALRAATAAVARSARSAANRSTFARAIREPGAQLRHAGLAHGSLLTATRNPRLEALSLATGRVPLLPGRIPTAGALVALGPRTIRGILELGQAAERGRLRVRSDGRLLRELRIELGEPLRQPRHGRVGGVEIGAEATQAGIGLLACLASREVRIPRGAKPLRGGMGVRLSGAGMVIQSPDGRCQVSPTCVGSRRCAAGRIRAAAQDDHASAVRQVPFRGHRAPAWRQSLPAVEERIDVSRHGGSSEGERRRVAGAHPVGQRAIGADGFERSGPASVAVRGTFCQ